MYYSSKCVAGWRFAVNQELKKYLNVKRQTLSECCFSVVVGFIQFHTLDRAVNLQKHPPKQLWLLRSTPQKHDYDTWPIPKLTKLCQHHLLDLITARKCFLFLCFCFLCFLVFSKCVVQTLYWNLILFQEENTSWQIDNKLAIDYRVLEDSNLYNSIIQLKCHKTSTVDEPALDKYKIHLRPYLIPTF